MEVKDITTLIEAMAPLSLQESYDNAGLICGSPEAEVRSALLATDVTEEVLDEAIAGGHDLIITHHPLTLQGVKHLRPEGYVQRCLIKAVRHELNLYAAHTNLDAVMQGVSGKCCSRWRGRVQTGSRQGSASSGTCPARRRRQGSSGG